MDARTALCIGIAAFLRAMWSVYVDARNDRKEREAKDALLPAEPVAGTCATYTGAEHPYTAGATIDVAAKRVS